MRTPIFAALLCLAACAAPAAAQTAAGGESMDFLLIDANARAAAMGGAFTVLARDSNSLLYNPAGLGLSRGREATFTHNQYSLDLTQENFGYSSGKGWAVGLNYLSLGNIPRSTFAQKSGTGANFGATDMAFSAGYGRTIKDGLSLGLEFKYLRETIDTLEADTYAFDVGALYAVPTMAGLTFGGAIQHIGPDIQYSSVKEKLPANFRLGAAYAFPLLSNANNVSFEAMKTRTDKIRINMGFETIFRKMMALRVGYTSRSETDISITAGLGFTWQAMSLDYAIVPMGDLGINHRVGLSFRWGEPGTGTRRRTATRAPQAPAPTLTVEDHFANARAALEAKDYAGAKQDLVAAAGQLGPNDRRRIAYFERMGALALKEGNTARAQTAFMQALKIATTLAVSDSSVADAYYGMGLCLLGQNDGRYAVKFFRKALELGPSAENKPAIMAELERLGEEP